MRTIFAAFARNTVFANVMLVIILMTGIIAATRMVREMFPEFSVDTIFIEVVFPGADPEEVEEGISRKIEEAIEGIEGIKRYTTISMENYGRAVVEVKESYDVGQVYDRVRNAVDSISTFPVAAEKPIISELTFRAEVLYLALYGDLDERTLKEWAERIKDELQALPQLSQVTVFGTREYEISIEVSEEQLRKYGLSFADVAAAVRRGSVNLSAGVMRTRSEEILLRTVGRKYTGAEFAHIVVLAGPAGELITLDQIATIRDGFTEDAIISTFNGAPCALIGVFKTREEDAIAIARAVTDFVEAKQGTLPAGVHLTKWNDLSTLIDARINLLLRNGLLGLCLVFLALWLFLDLRLSFWVAMGIPISLSGAMILMWMMGETLNMISLFGLIMVLGIIVDDAIVVGESIYVRRKNGDGPLEAAVNGVMEVGMPVLAAVTTTIVAFLPLMFVSGVMGKFITILPVVVICALIFSLYESLLLLPAHLSHLPDINQPVGPGHPWKQRLQRFRQRTSNGLEWFTHHVYLPVVRLAVHGKYVTVSVAIAVLLITLGLLQGGFVKFVMFPEIDGNDAIAAVEFPRGTPLAETERAVQATAAAFQRIADRFDAERGVPLIRNVYTVAGQAGEGFEKRSGVHLGQVRVELLESEVRNWHTQEILVAWEEEVGLLPGVLSQTFDGIETGPPGAGLEVWLQGEDMPTLLAVAEELKAILRTYDGVFQVQDDFRPGKNELRFDLKPEARTLGLTLEDLARQIYAGYFGEEAVRIQRDRDDVRVRVRYTEEERRELSDLEAVRIRTPQGHEVPLYSVAAIQPGQSYSRISRVDGYKNVKVTAEADNRRANADEVLADLAARHMPRLEAAYPDFHWSFEGAKKDSRDAFGSLMVGFPIAMVGVFVIIATIFRSYLQPFIIMFTVPFGIIGAVFGHLAMGIDVTMMSLFGMVALAGVVVNAAIVYIERVNHNLAEGMTFVDSVTLGGARRFRAILLTTISTVAGLAPMIREDDMQAQFLIPMALSIAAGVAFATLLTLLLAPCLLAILNDLRCLAHWMVHRRWPTREEVEPASRRFMDVLNDDAAGPEPAGAAPTVG
jgi:multidrug efflux pump subunit AcrB